MNKESPEGEKVYDVIPFKGIPPIPENPSANCIEKTRDVYIVSWDQDIDESHVKNTTINVMNENGEVMSYVVHPSANMSLIQVKNVNDIVSITTYNKCDLSSSANVSCKLKRTHDPIILIGRLA